MRYKIILFLFFSFFNNLSYASEASVNAENDEGKAPIANEDKTPTELSNEANSKMLIMSMQLLLPDELCKDNSYYRNCFQINPKECRDFTKVVVKACAQNVATTLPEKLSDEQQEVATRMVGRCTYDLYHKFLAPKLLDSAECNMASKTKSLSPQEKKTNHD